MVGKSSDARDRARPIDHLVVLVIGAALTAWSIAVAHKAYIGTPNIDDFPRFAEPTSSKHEAKSVYLFTPILFEVVGLLAVLASLAPSIPLLPRRVRDWLDPGIEMGRIEAYLSTLFFVACLLSTVVNSSHALHATHNLGATTHGAGPPRVAPSPSAPASPPSSP